MKKIIIGTIIGLIVVGVLFCISVLIGCSINKIGFVEQIQNWFGIVKEQTTETIETTAKIIM